MSETVDPSQSSTSTRPTTLSRTVPDAFRAVVAQHPDRIAYQDRYRSVTYAEFERESNAAANALLQLGDDRPLVLVAPAGIDSLVVMFGALKTGRIVVPLDPRWPVQQWLEVARRLGGHLVVPDEAVRGALPDTEAERALLASQLQRGSSSPPVVELDPDAAAFVFFTSGSTGAPKGTVVGHAMPMHTLDVFEGIRVDDRVALLAPLSFVTGSLAATAVVLTGASGHFFDATSEDLSTLPAWLDDHRITIMGLSVTIVGMIAKMANDEGHAIESLRFVGHGGEAGTARHFAECRRAFPNAAFRHGFGMTETGPVAGYDLASVVEPTEGPVPVGHPWPWIDVEIVDEAGRPVPAGVPGEIWVTGDQVALGYWDEPALTAERFLTRADGRRTVRTGDRGRFRADGMLEHLGRMDRRVKVHGQLVDLSQVELEVKRLDHVRDAVVSAVPTEDGAHRVVAHVVVDGTTPVTVGELRRGLLDRLPPYAIPRAFFRIDDIPQTNTGKVDRVWLRESAVGALPLETEYVAPRNDTERSVARLFEEVLAVERVGVHDDFFELGGDSLSVVDLLAGLAEDLGLDISASELLRRATVEAVARRGDDPMSTGGDVAVRVNDGTGPPLFCVPGAADTPVQFRALGRRLADTAVYAFAYRGMDHRAVPDQTIAAIARRNITAMRAIEPVGPYHLLGYSFGGTVALEMAHQLQAAGDEVALLALLEPSLTSQRSSRVAQSKAFADRVHQRAVTAHPGSDLQARVTRTRALTRAGVDYAARQVYLASAGVVARRGLAQHAVFFELHIRLLRAYRHHPYGGRTIVVASPKYLEFAADILDPMLPPEAEGGNRRDVPVAGEHLDLVREPNVAEVARAVDLVLATERV